MFQTPEASVVPSPPGLAQGKDVTGVILGRLAASHNIESERIQNLASMASPISISLTIKSLQSLSEGQVNYPIHDAQSSLFTPVGEHRL